MTTTTRRKEEERIQRVTGLNAVIASAVLSSHGPAYSASNAASAVGTATIAPSSTSIATIAGIMRVTTFNSSLEGDDYFKPNFARHLEKMLAAPLDPAAPAGEQEFMDWLSGK
jgi:hypothetical protein